MLYKCSTSIKLALDASLSLLNGHCSLDKIPSPTIKLESTRSTSMDTVYIYLTDLNICIYSE